MQIEHIKSENLQTSVWQGGTTTQLYIYPYNAEYKNRDFLFRVSTATIEKDESVFTKLPGIKRHLMLLNGNLKIRHNQMDIKTMNRFDIITFEGDWNTKSYGKATDFNLMMQETDGLIRVYQLNKAEHLQIKKVSYKMAVLYIYEGSPSIAVNNSLFSLNPKDVFVLKDIEQNTAIEIQTETPSVIAAAWVTQRNPA